MESKYDFGNRLYELRTQKKLTQKELGRILGVSNKAVSKWETGEAKPRVDTIHKLSQLLGVSVGELMGEESEVAQTVSSEQLQGYESYFTDEAKKLETSFKIVKILIIIITAGLLAGGCIEEIISTAKGIAGDFISIAVDNAFALLLVCLTLRYITKTYENGELSKNRKISKMFMSTGCVTLAVETFELANCLIQYKSEIFEYISWWESILTAVYAATLFFFSWIYKTDHKDTEKHSSVFYVTVLILIFSTTTIATITANVFFTVLLLFAVRFVCKCLEWNELAQKINSDYAVIQHTNSKRRYIITAAVAGVLIISLSALDLLAPFILYKKAFHDLPDNLKQPVPEFTDYNLNFDGEDVKTVNYDRIIFMCPEDWDMELYEEDSDYYGEPLHYAKYRDEEKGVFFYASQIQNDGLHGTSTDSEEFNKLDEETKAEILEHEQRSRKADTLYRKYFNISFTDMTIYQCDYLMYSVDLSDAKWYQTQKLATYLSVLMIKDVGAPLVESIVHYQTNYACGYVMTHKTSQAQTSYTFDIYSEDGSKKDMGYHFMMRCDNLSEDESRILMSKILNSVKFDA